MTSRGRGLGSVAPLSALRRPGAEGIQTRFSCKSQDEDSGGIENQLGNICEQLSDIDLTKSANKLSEFTEKVKSLCQSNESLEKGVDGLFSFALQSKWNSHTAAIFCHHIGDITVEGVKLRTHLLRKLQVSYKDRNKIYLNLEKFLLEVAFLCEIFHHVHIDGSCLKVLARPVIDYLGMLIDGGSQKEIEVFVEQFPKCYRNLKENDSDGIDILVLKIRKQIICESSTLTVRAMLLEIFEMILTDWQPLSQNAKNLYESLSKPIVKICE
ncbi:uncharacterized protein LOC129225968 [Uloborus diversus]|uniref:uncharacterized protein LOC129225968 n=1 Tax=Uloborus diversus TaxID=327109 RepID=UPI00240A8608|nr:uncharacterized protein LOC129225968 [Uloborus diversus]